MSAPRVSVVIVTRDSATSLRQCLEHVRGQSAPVTDVIVVDNASQDSTTAIVEEVLPDATIISLGENTGYCRANNVGIRASKADHVLLLNPDVFMEPTFVNVLVEEMERHPDLGAAGGKLLRVSTGGGGTSPPVIDNAGGHELTRGFELREKGYGEIDAGQRERPESARSLPGSAMLLRRLALDSIAADGEYLDEDFFAYKEDVDLCWRLQAAGWNLGYLPAAVAYHARGWGGTRRSLAYRRQVAPLARYHSFKNRYLLLLKHASGRDYLTRLPWIAATEVQRFGYCLLFDPSLLRAYVDVARLAPAARRRRKLGGTSTIPRGGEPSVPSCRIALVHDYLVHVRGGERVFQVLCETFPTADVFSLVYGREEMPDYFRQRGVTTSFVQRLPMSRRRFRAYLPLYPLAARCLDLREYDLVIASSSAWVHGVNVGDQTTLICYCYSPFRFIWSHYGPLVKERAGPLAAATRPFAALLRSLDRRAARRVDTYIAISRVVQSRIRAFYGRDSVVVPPPVDLDVFRPNDAPPADYFLVVSALMRYKRIDIAVEACTRLKLPLKVVGAGDDEARLRSIAGPKVEFLGQLPDPEVARLYQQCRAFLFTTDEDFGITPLEAMASGRPVVALAAGGALETVVARETGLFFSEPTAEALAAVLQGETFEGFDPARIRRHAENFGAPAFQEMVRATVDAALKSRSRRERNPGR